MGVNPKILSSNLFCGNLFYSLPRSRRVVHRLTLNLNSGESVGELCQNDHGQNSKYSPPFGFYYILVWGFFECVRKGFLRASATAGEERTFQVSLKSVTDMHSNLFIYLQILRLNLGGPCLFFKFMALTDRYSIHFFGFSFVLYKMNKSTFQQYLSFSDEIFLSVWDYCK